MTKRIFCFFFLAVSLGIFLSACNNMTAMPSITATKLSITPGEIPNSEILKPYDSDLWDLLFDKDMVMQINIAPNKDIWMLTESGNVVSGSKEQWTDFSQNDFRFGDDLPSDMAITSNGVVWIVSRHAISHYFDGKWNTVDLPCANNDTFPRLAVSHHGKVWISSLCTRANSLKSFDENQWRSLSVHPLFSIEDQVLVDANDKLWTKLIGGLGVASFDGSAWKAYRDKDVWPGYPNFITRIAVDDHGNAFSLNEDPHQIGQIDSQGNITKIPFGENLYLNEVRIRLFIDTNHNIWINACLKDKANSCISYYDGQKWTTFINLPFSTVADINEIGNSIMLFATEKGLYSYTPVK